LCLDFENLDIRNWGSIRRSEL